MISAVGEALERARGGGGPTLLECKTYRYSGHSRADAGSYRPSGELDEWLARDPIELYRRHLVAAGTLDTATVDALVVEIADRVEQCIERVMASEPAAVDAMFQHVYAAVGRSLVTVAPVILARLGDTVDDVVVLEWLVAVGATVQVGDPLVRVETDKVEVDIESPYAGTISELSVVVGEEVATGATLCHIATTE